MAEIVNPVAAQPLVPWAGENFWSWLFSGFSNSGPEGGGGRTLNPLQEYPGVLNPDRTHTVFPQVEAQYRAGDPGMQFLQQLLQSGQLGQPNPMITQQQQNIQETGGIGGMPTQVMGEIAQFGAPSNSPMWHGMQQQINYGAPSDMPIAILRSMLETGAADTKASAQMLNRANGGPTTAGSFLEPFLRAAPYAAPSIGGK
jgi:hypothetical protein